MTAYELNTLIHKTLNTAGISANAVQVQLLTDHLTLVSSANKRTNLTRIVSPIDAVYLHVLDSLLPLSLGLLSPTKTLDVLDIGTGGGFPGIPLAVMTDARYTLIDSVAKKVDAVSGFIKELGLEARVEARAIRAEDLARDRPTSFDMVASRAVANLAVLVEYAAPLLKGGGTLIAYKAIPSSDEITHGMRAAHICGMELVSRETSSLPDGYGTRELLVFKKIGEPTVTLPRRNGMAVKRPLE